MEKKINTRIKMKRKQKNMDCNIKNVLIFYLLSQSDDLLKKDEIAHRLHNLYYKLKMINSIGSEFRTIVLLRFLCFFITKCIQNQIYVSRKTNSYAQKSSRVAFILPRKVVERERVRRPFGKVDNTRMFEVIRSWIDR